MKLFFSFLVTYVTEYYINDFTWNLFILSISDYFN